MKVLGLVMALVVRLQKTLYAGFSPLASYPLFFGLLPFPLFQTHIIYVLKLKSFSHPASDTYSTLECHPLSLQCVPDCDKACRTNLERCLGMSKFSNLEA